MKLSLLSKLILDKINSGKFSEDEEIEYIILTSKGEVVSMEISTKTAKSMIKVLKQIGE